MLDQVDHPAGGGHHDVHALGQSGGLLLNRGTAIDGLDGQASNGGQWRQFFADLDGQLPGGHEGKAGGAPGFGLRKALNQGEAEGQCLPRAGLGLATYIATSQAVWYGQGLNFERSGNSPLGEGINQVLVDAQVGELSRRHGTALFSRRPSRRVVTRLSAGLVTTLRWVTNPTRCRHTSDRRDPGGHRPAYRRPVMAGGLLDATETQTG